MLLSFSFIFSTQELSLCLKIAPGVRGIVQWKDICLHTAGRFNHQDQFSAPNMIPSQNYSPCAEPVVSTKHH